MAAMSAIVAIGVVIGVVGRSLAAAPTLAVVAPESAEACDIAVALSPDDSSSVEPAAYQQPATAESGSADGEATGLAEPAADDAEAIEPLADNEGPPSWQRILRPIGEVTADATLPPGLLPSEVEHAGDAPRVEMAPEVGDARLYAGWGDNTLEWSASKSWHRPLYFEEVNLERHGYQCHPAVQPLVSGAHFFLTVPTLPYQATAYPPRECIYTLGHYRPGSCPPWQRHRLPWDARAAAVQAGVTTGLVFLIP